MAPSAADLARGPILQVRQGDCVVSLDPEATFATVLGSCISACVRDRVARVGGMNHFLLAGPSNRARDRSGDSARYGAYAMQSLIDGVLARGSGQRANLEFKVFGGGNIHPGMTDIGAANIAFLRTFLMERGHVPLAEDLGGNFARKVMFRPVDGRAFVRRLDRMTSVQLARDEIALAKAHGIAKPDGVVTIR